MYEWFSMLHHLTCKIIQECNDKMPKRNTYGKYDVMASFIMLCFLKYELMKPQMIQNGWRWIGRGMEGSGCGPIFFYEQFLNFITDIPYVMFPPILWIKCPLLMVALKWQALLRKLRCEPFTHYPVPSVMNGLTLCLSH